MKMRLLYTDWRKESFTNDTTKLLHAGNGLSFLFR